MAPVWVIVTHSMSASEVVLGVEYTVIDTKLGLVVVGGSENGLLFITLPQPSAETALDSG